MRRPLVGWTDEQVEQILGNLLRSGVIFAAGVVAVGGVLYLIRYGGAAANYQVFRGEPANLRGLSGISHRLWSPHVQPFCHSMS